MVISAADIQMFSSECGGKLIKILATKSRPKAIAEGYAESTSGMYLLEIRRVGTSKSNSYQNGGRHTRWRHYYFFKDPEHGLQKVKATIAFDIINTIRLSNWRPKTDLGRRVGDLLVEGY